MLRRTSAVTLLVLLLAACSSEKKSDERANQPELVKAAAEPEKAAAPPDEWQGVCDRYIDQCADKEDSRKNLYRKLSGCLANCTVDNHQENLEMCSFVFCGVVTGKCDNEEPDDKTILACIETHGWKL